jgi:ATP-binding cassette subfamily A (ABC1) protein 3
MSRITTGFSHSQLQAVKKIAAEDIIPTCPQNFNGFSECFAAITFLNLPGSNDSDTNVQYSIQVDAGLIYVNVVRHTSDFEERVLPLQWAIDQVSINHISPKSLTGQLFAPGNHRTDHKDVRFHAVRVAIYTRYKQ